MRAARVLLALLAIATAAAPGCEPRVELPVTFVGGPRVLAIKAEPPEVPAGASSTLTVFVAGAGGASPAVAWVRCLRAPLPGQTINPDCFDDGPAPHLEPAGAGESLVVVMPDVTADALGQPDASGGVYLTLVARVSVAGSALTAAYRLRLAPPGATDAQRNHNPGITGVTAADASGWSLLDEAAPRIVHAGDRLELVVSADPTSAESYVSPVGDQPGGLAIETLRSSWFATAGDLSNARTSNAQPSTVLRLDRRLPAPGTPIDVYVVIRDERGGTDWARRTLTFE